MSAVDRLAEIQARADNATDGPWGHEPPPGPGEDPMRAVCVYPEEDGGALAYVQPLAADVEFIAHARTDVPALVAALRAVLNACSTYEKTQAIYRIEMGQREIIRVVRAEIEAALGEVAS